MEIFWDDQDIASHRVLTERQRAQGALSGIELAHTGIKGRGVFLRPLTDEYGGSFENRLRLMGEVLEETVDEAKSEMAVAILQSGHVEARRWSGAFYAAGYDGEPN